MDGDLASAPVVALHAGLQVFGGMMEEALLVSAEVRFLDAGGTALNGAVEQQLDGAELKAFRTEPGHQPAFHKGDIPVIHDHEVEAQVEVAFLFQLMESPEELPLVAHVADGAVPDAAYALGVGGGDALAECALVFFHGVLGDDAEGEVVRLPDEQAARQAVHAETDFALPAFGDRRVRMDVANFQRLRVDIGEVPAAVHDEDRMVGTGCVDVRALQMPHLGDHAVVITVPDDPFARLLGLGVLADHVLKLGDVLDMVAGELEKFAFRPVGDVCVGFNEAGDEGLALKVNAFSVVRNLAEHVVTVPDCGDPVADGVYGLNRMPFGLHGQDRSVVEYLSVHCSLLVACPERHVLFSTW